MKKALLIIFTTFTLAGFVKGQSLELREHGSSTLINGTTITINGLPNTSDVFTEIDVKNVSASNTFEMKKIEMFTGVTGSKNAICWGVCSIPVDYGVNYIAVGDRILVDQDSTVLFSGHLYPQRLAGQTKFRYVWYDINDVNDSVFVDVLFDIAQASSINSNEKDISLKVFPNPSANGLLNIKMGNIKSNNTESVIITNVLGKTVYNKVIYNANTLKVNTSSFNEGIYFVSIYSNNKAVRTEKIIITHK